MDKLNEMLPCPFCGGDAKAYIAFPKTDYPWHISIEHDEPCPDRCWDGLCYATEAEAIAAWNRRAPDALARQSAEQAARVVELKAEIERLRESIKWCGGSCGPVYPINAALGAS